MDTFLQVLTIYIFRYVSGNFEKGQKLAQFSS